VRERGGERERGRERESSVLKIPSTKRIEESIHYLQFVILAQMEVWMSVFA